MSKKNIADLIPNTPEFLAFEAGVHAGFLFNHLEEIPEWFEIYKAKGIDGLNDEYNKNNGEEGQAS